MEQTMAGVTAVGEREPQRRGGVGCLARSLIGCGALLFVAAVAVVAALVMNWSKVRSLAHSAGSSFSEMYRVQAAVQYKYRAPQVFVRKNYPMGRKPVLTVQVVNLPAADGVARGALRQQALDVAATARDALSPTSSVSTYQVIFTRSTGVGIVFSSSESFTLSEGELPARQPSQP